MEMAVAEGVAEQLEDHDDVLEAVPEHQGNEVTITAYVPDRHSKRRVKSELHQYPLYVHLEIRDES